MRTVLVMNSGSIQDHAFADPSAVTAGVIAGFDGNGASLNLDSSDGDPAMSAFPDTMIFVQGHADLPRRTCLIYKERIKSVRKKAYAAPVKQVTTISAIPTGTAGVASVKVMDMTQGFEPYPRKTYEVKVTAGNTAAQIAGLLRDKINADPRAIVVATVSTNDLVLTAKDFGTSFFTAVQERMEAATVTGTTAPSLGSGTADQVRRLEQEHRGFMTGELYVNNGILGAPDATETFAQDGKNYNLYTIEYLNDGDPAISKGSLYQFITLALATAGVTGNLDDWFADYL